MDRSRGGVIRSVAECRSRFEGEVCLNHANMGGSVYSIPADTPVDELYSRQENYDTHATNLDDINSYFPVTRLHEAVASGRIAGVALSTERIDALLGL